MNPEEYETTRKLVGTQQDAADRLGVTRQLISAREKGTARITEEAAIAIRELVRLPKSRERVGMTWWRGLKKWERLEMFRRAKLHSGVDCSPAETFDFWERGDISMPNADVRRDD